MEAGADLVAIDGTPRARPDGESFACIVERLHAECGVPVMADIATREDGLYAATHSPLGTSYGVFGGFQVPVAGKTGTAEKVVTLPGYTGIQNQSWWCGYGPFEDPKLVVCAVIENGGHGGTAAAPAALRVFEQYFHITAGQQGLIHSD